jgi:hypothetical protein
VFKMGHESSPDSCSIAHFVSPLMEIQLSYPFGYRHTTIHTYTYNIQINL